MPTLRTRPFFTDNPGDLPYTYDVPASVELVVQSIVARFDGGGAGEDWLPCLSLYTQDGHLMARSRCDQVFAAGDTGVVTWGPFFRRQVAAATPSGASLAFASWRSNSVAVTGPLNSFNIMDLNPATAPGIKTNDPRLAIVNDPGHTPLWGISIPGGVVIEAMTSVELVSNIADGAHTVGWVIRGVPSVTRYGPREGITQSASFSEIGMADDYSAPDALYHVQHMGASSDWILGGIHTWRNWTTDPLDFTYGIDVTILGDLPT